MKNYLRLFSKRTLRTFTSISLFNLVSDKKARVSNGKKSVGLVRLGGLGDLIIFLDALRGYREFFNKEEYKLVVIVEDWVADILTDCPYADEIIKLDGPRFRYRILHRLNLLRRIREEGFEIFINAGMSRELLFGDLMTYASAARKRYGFSAPHGKIPERVIGDNFYTDLIHDPKGAVHEIERNAELVRAVGHRGFKIQRPPYIKKDFGGKSDYFFIVPRTSNRKRQWPPERFAELARILHKESGHAPALDSWGDLDLADSIITSAPELPWRNFTGALNLPELAGVLARAVFVVGNDGGPTHLSFALGTPTFVIACGAEFTAYPNYPEWLKKGLLHVVHCADTSCFECMWACKYVDNENTLLPCVSNITVQQVANAVTSYLSSSQRL